MITIVPADEPTRAAIMQSAPFCKNIPDCLVALNKNEQQGYILYHCDSDYIELIDLKTDDKLLGEGLIRAALNIALDKGVMNTICNHSSIYPYLDELGFLKENKQGMLEYHADIRSVLHCKCHEKSI